MLQLSNNCVYCKKLLPIFNKLPEKVGGCNFAKVNVSQARGVLRLSKTTISPIEFVPYIIFYVNGKPYMRYNGPPEMKEIQSFVVEVANNIQNKQNFSPDKIKDAEKDIPEYTIGKPLCGNGEGCYVHYDDAYPEMPPGSNAPAERKSQAQKGQYLGYEEAYSEGGQNDPNQEYREEYAQRQLPPHQRQPPPNFPSQQRMPPPQQQYPQQQQRMPPQQPQYPQQRMPPQQQYPQQQQRMPPQQYPQQQQRMPPPQQQYPQQQQRMPPPQQQYPQQQYPQQQQYSQIRSENQPRAQYPQQYPPPQYPPQGRAQPQYPSIKNQQYPPQGQSRNFMAPHTRGSRQAQYSMGGY